MQLNGEIHTSNGYALWKTTLKSDLSTGFEVYDFLIGGPTVNVSYPLSAKRFAHN